MPDSCDVVVTGIGCVTSLGGDRETVWRRLLAGDRGLRRLTEADFRGIPLGGRPGFPLVGGPCAATSGREPLLDLVEDAARQAVEQAGLPRGDFDPDRAGCVIGTSKGGLFAFARAFRDRREGERSGSGWGSVPPHAASAAVARRYALRGPCLAPVAACATGLVSVLRGFDLIRDGTCDLVVAGSGDASLHPAVLGSFRRMGVLATRFDDPSGACRPFSSKRDGFAVGEGAAVFVRERRGHARARGARPIASVRGGALLSDPAGLTAVDPRGETLTRAVGDALRRSGLTPADVGHLNLHGTATRTNDVAEAAGLRGAFGAALDGVACTALKGALGHQLGAAGAVELAATALAIRDGRLPPTATLAEPDPACPLPLSRSEAGVHGCGLKVSLGFGGHVAVACLGPA
jgi:3-oxoacyl-[acyl-carrier-protein] synthase II